MDHYFNDESVLVIVSFQAPEVATMETSDSSVYIHLKRKYSRQIVSIWGELYFDVCYLINDGIKL